MSDRIGQCPAGPDFIWLVRTLSDRRFRAAEPPHNDFVYETRFAIRSIPRQDYKEWNK
jgi:hypothetical protein